MDFEEWAERNPVFPAELGAPLQRLIGATSYAALQRALHIPPNVTTLRWNTASGQPASEGCALLNAELERLRVDTPALAEAYLHPAIPDCLVIPSPAQIPPLVVHQMFVVVDARCGEAVLRGSTIFAPGIIASSHRFETNVPLSIYVTLGGFELLKGSKATPEQAQQCLHIANGISEMSRHDIFALGKGNAVRITASLFPHPPLHNLLPGRVFPQNLPSMLVGHLLGAQPGDAVLDMCAAPGGKTTHVATLLQAAAALAGLTAVRPRVMAVERSASRVAELRATIDELGCGDAVEVVHGNAAKLSAERLSVSGFQRIILDPPCSGLGLRPKLSSSTTQPAEIDAFADYQRKLLHTAAKLLAPGGRIVYSTCTVTPQENEDTVAWGLENTDLLLEAPNSANKQLYELGSPGLVGTALPSELLGRVVRFEPQKHAHSIGFFVAVFQKPSVATVAP